METVGDEVLGLLGDALEELWREVQLGGGDVSERLLVGVAAERGEAGEQDVREYSEAPDVGRERDGFQAQDLGR